MRTKVPMRPDNKKVNVFNLSLASLLKECETHNISRGVHIVYELQEEKYIERIAE